MTATPNINVGALLSAFGVTNAVQNEIPSEYFSQLMLAITLTVMTMAQVPPTPVCKVFSWDLPTRPLRVLVLVNLTVRMLVNRSERTC